MAIDVGELQYQDWLNLVFNHDVTEEPWHFADEWSLTCSNAPRLVGHLVHLFREPVKATDAFSSAQVDQGLWFIPGPNGFLWSWLDDKTPLSLRIECIQAVESLYSQLFEVRSIGSSSYMWWDSVFTYCVFNGVSIVDNQNVLTAVVEVIARQLKSQGAATRDAAVHGVEHLIKIIRSTRSQKLRSIVESRIQLQPFGLTPD